MYGGGDASDLRDRPSNTVFGRVDRRTTRTFRVAVVAGRRSSTLTPPALRQMFDASGAKYRVVIISACYSGVFVPVLANPRTLVITAAAADRSSFGCEDRATWTYFAWPV
jgi:Peptidase C13 family